MIIENSNVAMYSKSSFEYSHQTTTSARIQLGSLQNAQSEDGETLQSAVALDFAMSQSISVESSRAIYDYEDNMSQSDRIKKMIIEALLGRLYGKDCKIPVYPTACKSQGTQNIPVNPYVMQRSGSGGSFGAVFETKEEYYQKQTVDFQASLQIQTPNQSYSMDLSISFSKEMYEAHSTRLSIGVGQMQDPLVINYGEDVNPFDNLSDLKFEFDLDKDGESDLIPALQNGSGYLALDKNDNGTIDDGSELFGTDSGNGFRDLSVYDSDKNGWIDEKDPVFDKLKIWQKNDEGEGKLVSLLDLNVGAIYLGDVESGYRYQDNIATTDAVQKSNGIFVKEDGSGLGTVSSLDIAV